MNGYDYEPVSKSPYLKLKAKGDVVKIRLVSTPIHFNEIYENKETGETKDNEKFAWVVIDRADGLVKAFKAGVMIYKKVKEYALEDDWGDPAKYDLTIKRTEEQGNYYSVKPSPKKSDLTEEELKAIKEANINLEVMFKVDDKGTSTFGKGGKLEEAEEIPKDDNEEINLDEIPF